MAKSIVIDGKNTPERLEEEFQKLLTSQEHITVTEFAQRAGIAYDTLTHRYREWAEKVRKLRDEQKSEPRKKPPTTQRQEEITGLEQAAEVIQQLRNRIYELSKQLRNCNYEDRKLPRIIEENARLQEQIERLRGVIVCLQQEIVRYASPELRQRLMKIIEEHAASAADLNAL
jgi:hypothetical protein